MSDFFGRLTARHAESSSSQIVPRVMSRFETPGLEVRGELGESRSATETKPIAAIPVVQQPVMPDRRSEPKSRPVAESVDRVLEPAVAPAERAVPVQMRVEQILKHVETIVSSVRPVGEIRTENIREPAVPATPTAPRIVSSVQPRVDPSRPSITLPARGGSDSTVIRVHIGRIDVRAASQPDRSRSSAAKSPELAKPMSLERYLGGKERA